MNTGKNWNLSSQTVAVLVAICLGTIFYFGYKSASKAPDAPLVITWRSSLISGLVMQVQNTSGKNLSCAMVVINSTQGQHRDYSFSLDPYKQQEIGIMECNWKFEHGEWVKVLVEGYADLKLTVP